MLCLRLTCAPAIPLGLADVAPQRAAADYIKAGAADYIVKHHLERLGPAVLRALALKHAREDQARAQEQLRQSEERFRTLIEGVRDVIFSLGPDGTIASLNPAFETT